MSRTTMPRAALAALCALVVGCSVDGSFQELVDGVPADASVDAPPGQPAMLVLSSTDPIDFGDVVVGLTSGTASLTVRNTGDLTSGAISVALDDPAAGFALTDGCSDMELAGHAMCTIALQLSPIAAGAAGTTLRITADPGNSLDLAISGTGLVPGQIGLDLTGYDFLGARIDDVAVTHTFTVTNNGQAQVGTPMATASGDAAFSVTATTCAGPLAAGDSCTVTVGFDPTAVGDKVGSLTVSAHDGGDNAANLEGTGLAHVRVAVNGSGGGHVGSTPSGIDCGETCEADFSTPLITLAGNPELGSTFMGWGTDCSGMGSCELDLTSSKVVTATFDRARYELRVASLGTGAGTIAKTADPPGAGTPCGPDCVSYPYGTTVTLSANAGAGSQFASWSGDCAGSVDCTLTIDGPKTAAATFMLNRYALTVVRSGAGDGSITGDLAGDEGGINCGSQCADTYAHGTVVQLTAAAQPGSTFASWTGCTSTTGATCSVTMNAVKQVTARFGLNAYQLAVTPAGNGAVASADGQIACPGTCSRPYNYGALVTLTAAPNPGWHFVNWTGDACNLSTATSCGIAIGAADTAVIAHFAVDSHTLTVTTGGTGSGTVSSAPTGIACPGDCTNPYNHGQLVVLTAAPTAGATVSWSGCDSSTATTCTIAMSGDRTASATFNSGPQPLTVTRAGNGTGSVTSSPAGITCGLSCMATFGFGTPVTLTAQPTGGAQFVGWSGDCNGAGTCQVTMNQAHAVTATFSFGDQTVTWSTTGSGSLTRTASNPATSCSGSSCAYPYGTNVTFGAAAAAGWTFVGWGGDACGGAGPSCTVTMTQAHTVTAEFVPVTRRLTVTLGGAGDGTVTPSPVGTSCGVRCWEYPDGQPVTLAAAASPGSAFTGWSACTGVGTCNLTLSADTAVIATFAPTYNLTVAITGTGAGNVAGGGINCGGASSICSLDYVEGTSVTLTAQAAPGSVFLGYTGGGCGAVATCTVTMSAARTVSAAFARYYNLTASASSGGAVTVTATGGSAGGSCGASCTQYTAGTAVSLSATPAPGQYFAGWTGDCAGQGPTCSLAMTADRTTVATFGAMNRLNVHRTGDGSVASSDGQIACGTSCTTEYQATATVTLTATAAAGSVFYGWTGAPGCGGNPTCTVAMTTARDVTATFYFTLQLGETPPSSIQAFDATVVAPLSCAPGPSYKACGAYPPGTSLTVTATAANAWDFVGWTGSCIGTSCVVTMSAPRSAIAAATPSSYPLTVAITSVAANQGGITIVLPSGPTSCTTGPCTVMVPWGTGVVLDAVPDDNRGRFLTWTAGPCAGSGLTGCGFVQPINGASATANFDWYARVVIGANLAATALESRATGSGFSCQTGSQTVPPTGTCSLGFARNTTVAVQYGGVGLGPNNSWTACAQADGAVQVVGGSGDCVDYTCDIAIAERRIYTSQVDFACN